MKLASLGLKPKQVFYDLFDFGDQGEHVIRVEPTDANAERGRRPRVLERRGESPPQDPDADDADQ